MGIDRSKRTRRVRNFFALVLLHCLLVPHLTSIVPSTYAFDSAEWHGKRELFAGEAERLMSVYTNCCAKVKDPAENVTIPVETYDDGSVKVLVHAGRAQYFLAEGLVWAEDVEVKKLSKEGAVETLLEAKNCIVDSKAKSGWAEGTAKLTQGKTTFSGKGVYFSASDSYVKVFGGSVVESSDLKFGGGMP